MSEAVWLAGNVGANGSSPLIHTDPHEWEATQALGGQTVLQHLL